MSPDPFASQQEIYELRSQLDRALIRVDELLEQRKMLEQAAAENLYWREYWHKRARDRRALIRQFIRDAREKRLV